MNSEDLKDTRKDYMDNHDPRRDYNGAGDFEEMDIDSQMYGERKPHSEEEQEKKSSPVKEALGWVFTFVAAIVVALVLKNYIIINATVPTGSMENTIMPGDDLFGFRLAYAFSEPERGDIIIFNYPDNEEEKYVKRVIGVGGDTVYINDAKIYLNGSEEPLQEDYLKEEWTVATGPFEFQVPEGCYLVLGDNRNDSWDARYWVNTYVTKDEIIGKAEWIYYPFSRIGLLD